MDLILIVKPTKNCNANCAYCYSLNSTFEQFMKISTLEIVINRIEEFFKLSPNSRINLIWHGGEPLLVPHSFWKYATELLSHLKEKYNIAISIQTNLLLRKEKILKTWLENRWKISTSLDGKFLVHSKNRLTSPYQYKTLLNNIRLVKKHQKTIGAVCVVTKYTLNKAYDTYTFFERLNINVRFNRVITKNKEFSISHKDYFQFLLNIANLWLNNPESKISVQPLESDIMRILGIFRKSCDRSIDCFSWVLEVDPDGEIYSCGRFAGHKKYRYGNVKDLSLLEALERGKEKTENLKHSILRECASCRLNSLCGGGCKFERLYESEEQRKEYCFYYEKYIKNIYEILEGKIEISKIFGDKTI